MAATLPFAVHRNALGQAVAPDVAAFARAAAGAHQAFVADAGRLWGARLDTLSWMGVIGKVVYLTADPHQAGYAPVADDLWSGPLPAGIAPANTSVAWAGRRWAMVMLPIPMDSIAAVRLLIHEAAHVAQPRVLPQPAYSETGAGSGLLDEPAGRTWLQLEWRALSVALRSTGEARAMAVRDALTFRAERYAIASEDERTRERVLDVTEGIPEYTAWQLTRSPRSMFVARLDSAATLLSSFVRGFPYYTGPAYAMLLDGYTRDTNGAWRGKLASTPDLQQLLSAHLLSRDQAARRSSRGAVLQALRDSTQLSAQQNAEVARLAEKYATRYNVNAIRAAEDTRWTTRQRELAGYRKRFVDGPTIRIRPGALNISFDPRRQASLGAAGTVMANLVWKSKDGAMLTAPGGALVTPTWSEVRVPLGSVHLTPGTLTVPFEAKGDGWALSIPAGWTVRVDGASWVIVTPVLSPATPPVGQPAAAEAARQGSCAPDAEFAITTIERNYAGFADKVTPRTRAAYDSATRSFRRKAAAADSTPSCYGAIESWTRFFRDGHLGVRYADGAPASASAAAALDTSPAALRARFENAPKHPVSEAQVRGLLATSAGQLDPIEGIWETIGIPYRLAVVPDSAGGTGTFLAVVLRADSAWWSPGQVKAALRADEANLGTMPGTSDSTVDANGSRYSVRYHYRDHTEQMTTARVTHGLLLFPDGSAWVRLAPHLATDADYATYAASLNRHTGVRSLDSRTVLLSLPSFDPGSGAVVDSVIRANRNVILGTENLIIDVRGNGGGSDYVYAPVLPFIATGSIRDVNASIYATPENTKKFEALLTDERIPPKLHTQIEDLVAAMRAHPGQFIHQPDEVTRFDTIFPRPRHVAVLTDQGCGSTCEQFVLAVRQSHKVTLMGERTAGVLDYANLQTVTMPSGRFTLHYGTSRSQRLPADPVDPNGIAPQVRVPAYELFPVEWARRYLEQLSR